MARFLVGLNREIQNVVELQHYVKLEDCYIWISRLRIKSRGGPIEPNVLNLVQVHPLGSRINGGKKRSHLTPSPKQNKNKR